MAEIKLRLRVKYAGDVHAKLIKLGWDLDAATLFVEDIPDADAVPVIHAQWINKQGGFWETADCSNCGERHPTVGFAPNYCPNCGARMDGDNGN